MKKILLCFLALVILFSCMTGCSDDSKLNPKKPVTLSMWHIYGEQTDSPLNQLVQEFNATVGKEKGIVIKVTNMTTARPVFFTPGYRFEFRRGEFSGF